MAPQPIALVGFPVTWETIEQYRVLNNLPKYNNRRPVQDLASKIGIPVTLVRLELDDEDGATPDHCLCCFAESDFSGRPYGVNDMLAIPIPPEFHQLPQVIAVEGDLRRLFAPMANMFSPYRLGESE